MFVVVDKDNMCNYLVIVKFSTEAKKSKNEAHVVQKKN